MRNVDVQKEIMKDVNIHSLRLSSQGPQSDAVQYIKEQLNFAKKISFSDEQVTDIDSELLVYLQSFPQTIKIGDDVVNKNFVISKGSIIKISNGITYKIAFDDISLSSNNLSKVVYISDKGKKSSGNQVKGDYILITSIDEFQGTLSKTEVNMELLPDIEPILKKRNRFKPKHNTQLRYDVKDDTSFEMFLLVKIDDISEILLDDPQILVNTERAQYSDIINEGVEYRLSEYPKYEFIRKLTRNTNVKLKFCSAFTVKRLDKLLDYTIDNYSNFKIQMLDSFYFITEENIPNLKRFLQRYPSCQSLKVRICTQEALLSLFELFAKQIVLNLHISYSNEKNEIVTDA